MLSPLREQVQDLLRADRAGALGDPIFVQILRGKRLDFWQFRLPQILDAVFPKGRGRWDLRPAVLGVLTALAVNWAGFWFWEHTGKDWLVGLWQAQVKTENGRWPVVIAYQDQTQALAVALKKRLSEQGFKVEAIQQGRDYTTDELGYPSAAKTQALAIAQTLRHLGYGVNPKLQAIPGDRLRLDLAHSYQALATLNDTLDFARGDKAPAITGPFQDDLKDGGKGPAMLPISPGSFLMGSPEDEKNRYKDESPQHSVTIPKPFAIGRDEVSFDEYDRFAQATGKPLPKDQGWGRGRGSRPVINVTWQDAQDYAAWLSGQTGQAYRLPTEAEWEYAARAGTATAYWWGDELGKNHANGGGGGSEWDGKQTAPVGSFPANPWGLRDTAGNVYEWVEDCWHDNYRGAPDDGRAWVEGTDCASGSRGGFAAVRGSASRRTCARPSATGTGQMGRTTASVSVSPGPGDFALCSLAFSGEAGRAFFWRLGMNQESSPLPKAVEDCHALLAWIIPQAIALKPSPQAYGQGCERLLQLGKPIGGGRRAAAHI